MDECAIDEQAAMESIPEYNPTEQNSALSELLAFGVELNRYSCICFALTPAKAKWIAVAGARDANFLGHREWPNHLSVWREERYDKSTAKKYGKGPYTEDYVRDFL